MTHYQARIDVVHLPGILDPQGATVERALPALGYDNVSEVLGVNTRLHWIPKAGQEGFIVLNHNLQDYDKNASFRSTAADVSVKFKYTFRF